MFLQNLIQFEIKKSFILYRNSKCIMTFTIALRQYKSTTKAMNAGNYKLALDHGLYPSSQTDHEIVVRKLGNSLINMPFRLQHAMKPLLICPPQPILFSNLQVLDKMALQQTLSAVLKHCPQMRELHHVSTQPGQCCAWADLQCCHTLEQLDQVILQCILGECMSFSTGLA